MTEVTAVAGDGVLREVTLTDTAGGTSSVQPCTGLFCFIGAVPATDWQHGVALDDHGFVPTDAQLRLEPHTDDVWTALDRRPFPFETSSPSVFAVGDVRAGSLKRVAAAVGEGASAVRSVHGAIGLRR